MPTMHQNFNEGFWFTGFCAFEGEKEIDKIVCVDFTTRKVKRHLTELVKKINIGWLPNDEEIAMAEYDN